MQEIEKPNHQYYAVVTIASALAFKLYSVLLEKYGPTPEVYKKNGKLLRWFNIIVSSTHSAFVSAAAFYCFYVDPDLALKINHPPTLSAYIIICISLGYFVHDFIRAARQLPISTGWEIMLHHFVVIVSFSITIIQQRFINFGIVSLFTEFNSVFLYFRLLMNMAKIPLTTSIYRLNNLISFVTYIIFRMSVLVWMMRWLFINKNDTPLVIYWVYIVALCLIFFINTLLIIHVLKKDYWNKVETSNLNGLEAKKVT